MPQFDFDLFTIGAGSGGVRASRFAAGFGARVAVAEERYLGGTCVNVGCIPKKLYSYAAHVREEVHLASGFGWKAAEPTFDLAKLAANKNQEIERLNGIYRRLLEGSGVKIIDERATVVDAHTVEAGGKRYTAAYILVAVGGWPVKPAIPGADLAITSNEAFYLDTLPQRVLVVGGGYIALEFASIFNGMGADSNLIYRGPNILRSFDREFSAMLADEMQKKGVTFILNADITTIERHGRCLRATMADGTVLEADCIMYATGRAPNTHNLGLEAAGVKVNAKGAIVVDGYSQSTAPSVYAIGDVTDRVNLTPVATAEGMAVANTLFNRRPTTVDYSNIPTAIFADPNAANVGLGEEAARAQHGEIDVYTARFRPLKHTLSGSKEQVFMKLVVERASDRVVGAHMVGVDAGEVIQGIAIALKCGATKAQFDATIGIHPTAAEEFVTMRTARKPAA
ncbi:MAG: glutathione-disulfide reductase [Betaproteobacteria bacterium]|nr:glutathione-disulfide reductase [Betaproteobacteria bacterium]